MTTRTHLTCQLMAVAAAALTAVAPVMAAETDEFVPLTGLVSTIGIGFGNVNTGAARFGQYSGLNSSGGYGLFDADIVRLDTSTGTWLNFRGRNLGLDSRELRFEHQRQGDWSYYIDFGQTPRYEPYTVRTAVGGINSANLTVPATLTAGGDVELKTTREAIGLGLTKWTAGGFELQLRFRNEEKDGARVFARGTTGGGVVGGPVFGRFEFTPEPINSTIRQLEATIGYAGQRLQFSGGYYGTTYDNHHSQLNINGGLAALSTFTPIGLPPDNYSHQFHLAGGYSFTPTTRGTFKLAYTRAIQDDLFPTHPANVPLVPGVGNNLQGRVDTTMVQIGLTARPIPKLSLLANARYDDRNDKTPVLLYNNLATATSTFNGQNEPRSIRTVGGKLEASYALPLDFRLTGGIDYEEKRRNSSPVRIVNHRETTEETSYRVELRRSMSDTLTGALAYVRSERGGSPFLTTTLNNGTAAASGNRVGPIHLADRDRDRVRLTLDWSPVEPLSLQFAADESRDHYAQIHVLGLGPRKGEARNYSLDAAYTFSEAWQGTAYFSRNETQMEQSQHAGAGTTGLVWSAALRNVGDTFGLGLRAKPGSRFEFGADLSHSNIDDEYGQSRINTASLATVVAPLPNISTKLTRFNLYGKYALQKTSGLRLDYIYDRYSTDDWTWTTWQYADGTQLYQNPNQKVHFIGASVYFRWQ
jgi:MtrB/PioB family decaheme-associated outer membrane protein